MEHADKGAARILIVDDLEANRCILEEIIQDMGCRPVAAASGEEALQLIGEARPRLILSDISMPGMDGYELCRALKNDKKTKNIPIIFISAYDNPKDIIEGFSLGGADYITKPFVPEVVQARVGVHLRLYEASRELEEMNHRLHASLSEQLKQIEQEKKDVLYALAGIAARNSCYRGEHIERLKENCRILAQGMQLSPLFEDKFPMSASIPWSWRRRSATSAISESRWSFCARRKPWTRGRWRLCRPIQPSAPSSWATCMWAATTMTLSAWPWTSPITIMRTGTAADILRGLRGRPFPWRRRSYPSCRPTVP